MAKRSAAAWLWPSILLAAAVAFLVNGARGQGLFLLVAWAVNVLFLNPTRCRVEKVVDRSPCTKDAQGILGTCRNPAHRGAKWQALPHFVRVGTWGRPQLMWPNQSRRTGSGAAARSGPAPAPRPAGGSGGRLGDMIAIASLVVAIASFVRDLVAG
jgi:hypothetical protein